MTSESAIDEWRQKVLAYDREAAALRSGHGPGHDHQYDDHTEHGGEGHVHGGHGGFPDTNQDPRRGNDPVVNSLFALLKPDSTVLDVGGGSGRFALPLATRASRVTVVEPSENAVETLRERAAQAGLSNITAINHRWEDAEAPTADFILCSLVLHHVPEAVQFIAKMQGRATERVALVEMVEPPSALEMPLYERVYGSAPTQMPGLPELVQLLWAMDIHPDVTMLDPEIAVVGNDRDAIVNQFRRRLGVEESTPADSRFLAAIDELLEETPRGFTVAGVAPRRTGIITWRVTQESG